MSNHFLIHLALSIFMVFFTAYASDPNMLQDFCVAANDPKNTLNVNGLLCKDPNKVTSDDFVFRGLHTSTFTIEGLGLSNTVVTTSSLPGLNTMGISVARLEYALNGLAPPHIHPRSSEILTILKGTIYAGFISGTNKLYSTSLNSGDVFVFPQGLVHFHANIGNTNAIGILAFSSQNPGTGPLADKIFGSQPPIPVEILSKAFQLDPKIIENLQSKF